MPVDPLDPIADGIAVLVVTDPDRAPDVRVYVDGKQCPAEGFMVDAGRGWDLADWLDARNASILAAQQHGGELVDAVAEAFDDPPGAEHIDGWADRAGNCPLCTERFEHHAPGQGCPPPL